MQVRKNTVNQRKEEEDKTKKWKNTAICQTITFCARPYGTFGPQGK